MSANLNMACLRLGGTTMPMDGPISTSRMIFTELITFTATKGTALLKMLRLELCPILLGFQWGRMWPISIMTGSLIIWLQTWLVATITKKRCRWEI